MTGTRPPAAVATAFLRWVYVRAALARGYWLTTALYLVVVAHLTPVELILIGTFQGLTVLAAEVPTGVLADVASRRLSLVVGHLVMGAGMAMAGLVRAFPLIVVSQCLWGLGWAFSTGADVAWLTDELDRPGIVDRVLVASARWDLVGTSSGLAAFGALAWATTLSTAIVAAGAAMALLGLITVARWPETRFTPADTGDRWRRSTSVLQRGLRLARTDKVVLVILAATLLVNGSGEAYGRLLDQHLVALGMPVHPAPIVWFAAISVAGVVLGALVLRVVERRVAGAGVLRRTYVLACAVGVMGLILFAHAPNAASAVAGSLLVSGIAQPVIRTAGVVWVNRRATSGVRATVHSLLSQSEQIGEIIFGVTLAALAGTVSTTAALSGAAVLLAVAGAIVAALRGDVGPPGAES